MDCRPVALLGGACTLGATIAYQLAAKGYSPIIIDQEQDAAFDIVADDPRVRFKALPNLTVCSLQTILKQSVSQLAPVTGVVLISPRGKQYIQLLGYQELDLFCQKGAACVAVCPQEAPITHTHNDIKDTSSLQRFNSISFRLDHSINTDDETLSDRKKCEILSPLVCFLLENESKFINKQVFSVEI
ncbi:hypothetical protein [Salinivibrio sp. ES.052]|uniref:hypothetical protein n=1 Tax=Salinivibrio sp. ES.052 TaxID=1882823 RepID=UPI00092C484A|nr:hypothetical protein [Salinivibrio sp. ES.052]SIN85901.1 hypothetical protein SAMN05444724_0909 [Salinivibrio sp. ES.052]